MKQIIAFQTSDNKTFTDRIEAEEHELMIFVRGVIQSKAQTHETGVTGAASCIARNQDEIYMRLQKHRRTVQGLKQAANKKL